MAATANAFFLLANMKSRGRKEYAVTYSKCPMIILFDKYPLVIYARPPKKLAFFDSFSLRRARYAKMPAKITEIIMEKLIPAIGPKMSVKIIKGENVNALGLP